MLKLKYMLSGLAMSLSLTSCLDKYPSDAIEMDQSVKTVREAEEAVVGLYAHLMNASLYSGSLTLLPDLQCDLLYAVEGYSNVYGDVWRWNIQSTNEEVKGVWGALYAVAGQANFILEKLEPLEGRLENDDDFENIQYFKGCAYFARALAHAELLKLFAKAYDPVTADALPGVILSKSYSQAPVLRRASLRDSYAFVLADLKQAEQLLADKTGTVSLNMNTFNEYTVYALTARTALYMKDWQRAIDYSSRIIDSKKYALADANVMMGSNVSQLDYMWQYDAGPEVIFRVGFTTTNYGGRLGQVFFNAQGYQNFKPDYVPARWVLDLYSTADRRYDAYFGEAETSYAHKLMWPLLAKYYGNVNFLAENIYHVAMPKPFRLAEQYLIRAEAYCRQAQPQYSKASADLTTLMRSRYASFGSISVGPDSWLTGISEERVRELLMEGFRLQDLKRWAADGLITDGFRRQAQQNSLSIGSNLHIAADNPLFVWPIPQHELNIPGTQVVPNDSNK